jgi:predicted DNA-binding transcriptional regulator AlpA
MGDNQIKLLRFSDLKEANVVTSWPQLRRLVRGQKFPPGYMLSPAVRVWDTAEIQDWLEGRRRLSALV